MTGIINKSIVAKGIGKRYTIGAEEQHYDSFREYLTGLLLSPFRKYKALKGDVKDNLFWALQDISFEIKQGDIVGVIGHNGAGKSTLLKVLSRITVPTEGEVQIKGRVASLLEVGTGFHPELTGRENIYLNGSILGMTRSQIDKNFDEIVAFAEVEKFLDTPVKRYSSGMYVRLAFAVAAHLDSDVLLVDEVLAVGDQAFQQKCLGKLDQVSEDGRTVFFVSHNLSAVSRICNQCMYLQNGKMQFFGDTRSAIDAYVQSKLTKTEGKLEGFSGTLENIVDFKDISINGVDEIETNVSPFKEIDIKVSISSRQQLQKYRSTVSIMKEGVLVVSQHDTQEPNMLNKGQFEVIFSIPEKLLSPGRYSVALGAADEETGRWLWGFDLRFFYVNEEWALDYLPSESMGIVNMQSYAKRKMIK